MSITSFIRFPDLPPEIRVKIIRYASRVPRVVELSWKRRSDLNYSKHLRTKASVPSFLQVNKEARAECLKRYKLCLNKTNIYFDPSIDTILFDATYHHDSCKLCYMLNSMSLDDFNKVQHLSIHYPVFVSTLEAQLKKFKALQSFTICFPEHVLNRIVSRGGEIGYGFQDSSSFMKQVKKMLRKVKRDKPGFKIGQWGVVAWNKAKDGLEMIDDRGAL